MSNYKNGGYDEKYIISKKNGNAIDQEAVYFVLRLDKDPHALNAIETYIKSVGKENPVLANDLKNLVLDIVLTDQEKDELNQQ